AYTRSDEIDKGIISTIQYGELQHNNNKNSAFKLAISNRQLNADQIDTWNLLNIATTVCDDLKNGMVIILCGNMNKPHEALSAIAENMEIPLVNWDLAPILPSEETHNFFQVSVCPPTAELIADLILHKQWPAFVYLHDGKNCTALYQLHNSKTAINLQWIYHYLHRKSKVSIPAEMVRLPKDENKFPEFFRKMNAYRLANNSIKYIVIDAGSSYRQKTFLAAMRSAQFSQLEYHYIVGNYDFSRYDVEMFQNGNINISGFQIINREKKEYLNLRKNLHNVSLKVVKSDTDIEAKFVFVHDAMLVLRALLTTVLRRNDSLFRQNFRHGQLYNRGYPGIYCHPNMDHDNPHRPFTTFEHGQALTAALRGLKLDSSDGTLTGRIEFDRFGMRKNYDVTVIDLVSSTQSAFNKKEMMIWKQGLGFFANQTFAEHTRKNLGISREKKVLKVVTIVVRIQKFSLLCLILLSTIEDFKNYEIILAKGNKYGIKQPDGSWDGLIGSLLSGEADLCVASLTINQDRERVVDFSKPFMTTGISIMIKKPDKQEFSVFSFMQPLSTEIWMYIIFAYVGVSVVIFFVSRFSPYEWRIEEVSAGSYTVSNDFSVYNCLWFTLAAFMQQGTDIVPRSISGRLASSAWWFFTMIIVSSYTANLAAFLTLEKMQAPIESVEDLAKQTKIKYGIQQGGSTAQFFKYSSVQIYQRMWRYMESQVPTVFTSTYAEGIERVRNHKGRYAFLLESTANEYANTRKPCDTMKVGKLICSNLNSIGYGVATPFGSPYKDHINLAILALQERGELKKLENKWWYDRGECDQGIAVDGHNASLNLSKVAGIFYILIGGMIASMLAAFGEFLYRSRIEARRSNMTSLFGSLAENLRSTLSTQPWKIAQDKEKINEGTPKMLKKHDEVSRSSDSKFSRVTDDLVNNQLFGGRYNTAV
ncbi:unnamed protein product, partial [Thelazia callipaeda]|uniref:Glutamate receptor 1 n=1 Tax=Thelazia callipaeda TaxID=103827 RepID=A0A0N5CP85_THECL